MKKLFQASFEQSLKLNNDNVMTEYLEKSSKRSIWYRIPGPLVQGLSLFILYYGTIYTLYGSIPKLWIQDTLIAYTICYWIIYLISQIIICRKQIFISDCLYKITAGQYMILLSFMALIFGIVIYDKLNIPILVNVFLVSIFLFSFIYFVQKLYNNTLKILYNKESENTIKWFDHFYRWIMKYGSLLVIGTMLLKWLFGKNFDNLEGALCALIMPLWIILSLNMGMYYLFEFVNAYYLVKYSEEYREYYGFTVSEWYGKYSKHAMKERRMKKKEEYRGK